MRPLAAVALFLAFTVAGFALGGPVGAGLGAVLWMLFS